MSRRISNMEGKLCGVLTPFQVVESYVESALYILWPVPLRLLHSIAFTVCALAIDELNDAFEIIGEVFLPILVLEREVSIADEADSSLESGKYLANMLNYVG